MWLVYTISSIVPDCRRGHINSARLFKHTLTMISRTIDPGVLLQPSQASREDSNLTNDQVTIRVWDESRSDFIEFKLDKIGCRKMVTFRKETECNWISWWKLLLLYSFEFYREGFPSISPYYTESGLINSPQLRIFFSASITYGINSLFLATIYLFKSYSIWSST